MSSSSSNLPIANKPKLYPRELVLLTTFLVLLLLAIFTAFAARSYHKKYHMLGDEWFAKGEASYQAGDDVAALGDYRNALLYSPANPSFQFHLAKALAGTGRYEEARAYLLNLLSESPGSGQINLELARIAARTGPKTMPEALRYYHAAIYGEWDTDPMGMRWQIRKEFCEYLLDNHAMNQAEAEVIALADNTGFDDSAGQQTAGALLLRAHMWSRALQQFQNLLTHDPENHDALAGAATAEFQLAQYARATEYFDRLPSERRTQTDLATMVAASKNVSLANPFLEGLSIGEKARRTTSALAIAQSRAAACSRQFGEAPSGSAPVSALQQSLSQSLTMTAGKAGEWSDANLRKNPERAEPAMSAVFEMEVAAADECGEPQGADYALWLLAKNRGGNGR